MNTPFCFCVKIGILQHNPCSVVPTSPFNIINMDLNVMGLTEKLGSKMLS